MHNLDASCFVHTFSLFHSMHWYACHACLCHTLAFDASLYTCSHVYAWVCLLVCHPYFNTMKLLSPNPNLHLSLADTIFCLLACLFAFLLVCLLSRLFVLSLVCSHPCFYICHIYHVYLLHAFIVCSLHIFLLLLACWFLVFAFACTQMEWGRMELRHCLLGTSKKGEDANMSI